MIMEDQVFGGEHQSGRPARPLWLAMGRGARGRCPRCGEGKLFSAFLTTAPACSNCGQDFHHHRADDLPAYLVIVIVGHVVIGAFMGVEATSKLALWQHAAIWAPLTILLSLTLIRPIKGAVVGLQWAFYMHGFGGDPELIEDHPER